MNIVVCIKRVPDLAEAELEVRPDGQGVVEDDLAWGINEWDNVAVETAVRLKEAHGGTVTAVTVGADEDDEDVLRRALAMGADTAVRLNAPAETDALGIAAVLQAAIAARPYDLVLCGAISADLGRGVVGGLLAAALGVPMVALATDLTVSDGVATVRHEVENGLERIVEVDLPAVVTVQTGLCEPRYVSIRGIRKVAGAEIPVVDAEAPGARVVLEEMFLPPRGEGAEMLEGSDEEMVAALVERLHERGGL